VALIAAVAAKSGVAVGVEVEVGAGVGEAVGEAVCVGTGVDVGAANEGNLPQELSKMNVKRAKYGIFFMVNPPCCDVPTSY